VKPPPVPSAFVSGINEERPNITGFAVPNRETDDFCPDLDQPTPSGAFDGIDIVVCR